MIRVNNMQGNRKDIFFLVAVSFVYTAAIRMKQKLLNVQIIILKNININILEFSVKLTFQIPYSIFLNIPD